MIFILLICMITMLFVIRANIIYLSQRKAIDMIYSAAYRSVSANGEDVLLDYKHFSSKHLQMQSKLTFHVHKWTFKQLFPGLISELKEYEDEINDKS